MIAQLHRTSGFTLIELIVGMLIFSIGMTAILALLHSTIDSSLYSRHEIIAGNLLREEIELVKNIRNQNVRNFIPFDSVKLQWSNQTTFSSWTYIVENNYSTTGVTLNVANGVITDMPVALSGILLPSTDVARFNATRLYFDSQGRFTHTPTATGTIYASYITILPLEFRDGNGNLIEVKNNGKTQGYTLDARLIIESRGYKEYDLKSIITDWK